MAQSAAASVSGGFVARSSASAIACFSSSRLVTIRLTRPRSRASLASNWRPLRINSVAALAADMPWQTLRSAKRRNDADIDFCLGKDGCVRGKGDVHRLHELAATTEREAIDGRDDRLRKLLDPTGQLMPRPHEMRDRFGWACLHM